ncbi:MAG: dTDP-4-dehydrorhamnose reductase [Promethearchaeia archaeon]
MKKILIIGASGLTGYQLANLAKKNFEVYGTFNKREISIPDCHIFQLDKTDSNKTQSLLSEIKPELVIDCSALHNVDYCEEHKDETLEINTESPKSIAQLCKDMNARFLNISTDYVFDGTLNRPYKEDDEPNPLNFYGISKRKAEQEIAKIGGSYAIARTSLIFGWNPHEIAGEKSSSGKSQNFVIWALSKLRNEEPLKIVTDQYSNPTFANNLAEMLLALGNSNVNGIFHTAGKTCLSRYDFTREIAEVFNIDPQLISPVTSDEFNQVAERPMRPCLNVSKITEIFDGKILSSKEALENMKELEMES